MVHEIRGTNFWDTLYCNGFKSQEIPSVLGSVHFISPRGLLFSEQKQLIVRARVHFEKKEPLLSGQKKIAS